MITNCCYYMILKDISKPNHLMSYTSKYDTDYTSVNTHLNRQVDHHRIHGKYKTNQFIQSIERSPNVILEENRYKREFYYDYSIITQYNDYNHSVSWYSSLISKVYCFKERAGIKQNIVFFHIVIDS